MRRSPLERGPVAAAKDETILSRHSVWIWEIRLFGYRIALTDVRTWIRPAPATATDAVPSGRYAAKQLLHRVSG